MATGDGVRRCTPTARRQYAGSTRSFRPEPRELSLGEADASMIDGVMPVSHGETYSCPMSTTVSMSKARSTLPHLVDQARHDTVFLTKRGHTVGVLLSPDAYECRRPSTTPMMSRSTTLPWPTRARPTDG